MSDKAGSDLDVFDGLAAKKSRPSGAPAPRAPAAPPSSATRQKTLLGLAAPVAPGSRPAGPPPPPPTASRPPAPPPPRSSIPAPPASKASATSSGGFPTPPPPPSPSSIGGPPPPPPTVDSDDDTASMTAPPAPIAVPLSSNPARLSGKPADEDDKTPVPAKADAKPGVDIDWDDEDEATMVFDKSVEDTARSLLHSAPPPSLPAPLPAAGAPAPSRQQVTLMTRPSAPPPPTLPRAPLPPPKAVPTPYVAPAPPAAPPPPAGGAPPPFFPPPPAAASDFRAAAGRSAGWQQPRLDDRCCRGAACGRRCRRNAADAQKGLDGPDRRRPREQVDR